MRITTDLLSQLALATDVTDRDVFSQLVIGQETIVQVPEIPLRPQVLGGVTIVARTSFVGDPYGQLPASSAALDILIATLGRGLWRLSGVVSYRASFAAAVAGAGFTLAIANLTGTLISGLINLVPTAGVQVVPFAVTLLLSTDTVTLRLQLGATGVGQDHQVHVSLHGTKLL